MEYDASIAKAAEYACGNTLITKDYASAEPLVRKLRLVTMQGELIEASGLVTGGQTKRKINVYAEQAAVAKWNDALEASKAEKASIHSELESLRDSLAETRREKARVDLQLRTVELELEHLAKTESEWLARNADAKNASNALKKEIKECDGQAGTKENEKRALIKKLSDLNVSLLSTKQKVDVETEERLGNLVREKQHKATELSTELNKYKARFEGAENKKGYAEREANSARKRFDEVETEIKACRNAINQADDDIRSARGQLKEKKEKQKEFSKEFAGLLDDREQLEKEMGKLGNEKGKLEFECDRLRRDRQGDEVQKARLEEKLVEAKARREEYADVEPIQGKKKGDEPALLLEKKKLDEALGKLGTPNLAAIDKYEQRAKDLQEQKNRVEQLGVEKDAVISIINEIESKKKNTFMNTFDHINASFKNLFKEIFTGKGSLYLENPDNPFEGGLTIQVQLEDKEIKYLELMSGGEKSLIALLFIFAMQSANPGSAYILDEADAALDQENSRKLALLLTELSKHGQFIVVTHNEAVYKHADCLVGIAMQGKQGSKIVEVNVSQYKKN
jgi:chromosome segregation protein